jgi:hypothetical protein
MHPPSHICEALYRADPLLRLAWEGRPGFNEGWFHLIKLYPSQFAWSLDKDPVTVRMFWDLQEVMDEWGVVRLQKYYRGPLFDRKGGGSLDYDPLKYYPVSLASLNESWGTTTYDVFSGRILTRLLKPHQEKRKIKESAIEEGKELDAYAGDLAGDMIENMAFEGNKTGAASVSNLALKHAKEQVKSDARARKQLDGDHSLADTFVSRLPKEIRDA